MLVETPRDDGPTRKTHLFRDSPPSRPSQFLVAPPSHHTHSSSATTPFFGLLLSLLPFISGLHRICFLPDGKGPQIWVIAGFSSINRRILSTNDFLMQFLSGGCLFALWIDRGLVSHKLSTCKYPNTIPKTTITMRSTTIHCLCPP